MIPIDESIAKAIEHLKKEFDSIRTGRANPAVVESIMVSAYGTMMPLQQLAAVNVPEPRLLVIQPWDAGTVKDIEKALTQSPIGITPVVDGAMIRLPFPAMTEERRKALVKSIKELAETARVHIRSIREEHMKDIKRRQTDGEVSEDAAEVERDAIERKVKLATETIEERLGAKEEEVMTV